MVRGLLGFAAQKHSVSAGQMDGFVCVWEAVVSHTKLSNSHILLIECLSMHK